MDAHNSPSLFRTRTLPAGLTQYFPTQRLGHGLLVSRRVASDSDLAWWGLALRELPGDWVGAQETCAELTCQPSLEAEGWTGWPGWRRVAPQRRGQTGQVPKVRV